MAEGDLLCSVCESAVEGTLYWQDGEQLYCGRHKPIGGNVVAKLSLASRAHTVRGEINVGADAILKDLQNSRDEMNFAKAEIEEFRQQLQSVDVEPSIDGVRSSVKLVSGDKTDFVMARHAETGARVERQLVGVEGSLKLMEKGKLNGVPLWSVAAGKLVSCVGTVEPTLGKNFHLKLEGPHSEMQIWCRGEEQLDSWLWWLKTFHPQATLQREPPLEVDEPVRRRPVAWKAPSINIRNRLSKSLPRASFQGSDTESQDESSSMVSSSSKSKGRRSPSSSSPKTTLERKFHKGGMFTWAKKMYGGGSKTAVADTGRKSKQLDVFTSSLEDLMEEQSQSVPNVCVPLLLEFLADEVIRLGGCSAEGIFRISASHDEVSNVVRDIKKLSGYDYASVTNFEDPHVPSALFKQVLRGLPVPLFEDYFRCIEISRLTEDAEESYKDMMLSLSKVHRNVVLFLIDFLKKVGDPANVVVTKMDLANLALVFVPSFLRCPNQTDVTMILTNQPAEQKFVTTLVEYGATPGWLDFLPVDEEPSPSKPKEMSPNSLSPN
jgi:hypothetical protein